MVYSLAYQQFFSCNFIYFSVQSKMLDLMLFLQSYPDKSKWGRKLGMSWMNRMVRTRFIETNFASFLCKIVIYFFHSSYNCTAFCPQDSTVNFYVRTTTTDSICSWPGCFIVFHYITCWACTMYNTWYIFLKPAFSKKRLVIICTKYKINFILDLLHFSVLWQFLL